MRKLLFTFIALLCATLSNAQIGYQVALLNTATGEPRSNETVTCEIKLTNSEGGVVYEGTKKATSNDFGVVSLTVGDANTFAQMDWSKLPLYISVSVEGKLVGQTQVLTVPVAEHAKHYGTLTYENIGEKKVECYCSYNRWNGEEQSEKYSFSGHSVSVTTRSGGLMNGEYFIDGNSIFGIVQSSGEYSITKYPIMGHYSPESDTVYMYISIF